MSQYYYPEDRVAVVATSCFMPEAEDTFQFWENILSKKVSIREIPDEILDKSVFYRPEVFGKIQKMNKSYTKIAGVAKAIDFSDLGRKYRIPPAVAEYMDENQKATVYCVDQALEKMKNPLPKDRTAVILCAGAPGNKYTNLAKRLFFQEVEKNLRDQVKINEIDKGTLEEILENQRKNLLKDTQSVTEDTTTGYLQNLTAGRISNIFDFRGPSYIVDSACASSLTAIAASVSGLLNYEYDAVVSGGVEVTLSELALVAFSGINALSPDGSFPFDARANGFVMGQGGGIVILKRLADAIRDGDHICSIISGCGQGSDGKGKYIAAPSEEGQVRAIRKACEMAGYPLDTVEMIEAHGTGTIVGDVVEVSALKRVFQEKGVEKGNSCGLGSVKSNVGHLKNAAGVAGFLKATLALENKILPATASIKEVNPRLALKGSPFYILQENKIWVEDPHHPRRANVSAYGFGGANCHICLEEFRPEFLEENYGTPPVVKERGDNSKSVEREEVVFFSGEDYLQLEKQYLELVSCEGNGVFSMQVYQHNLGITAKRRYRLAICAVSIKELEEKWNLAAAYLKENKYHEMHNLALKGIYFGQGDPVTSSQTAIMFPGQGSQYPDMLKDVYDTYPIVKALYTKADGLWKKRFGQSMLPIIFSQSQEGEEELKDTKNTHPAMFYSNMGIYTLLKEAGIKGDYFIGHSLGEVTALYAAGMLDLKSAIQLVGERGYSFDQIEFHQRGAMISVKETKEKLQEIISSKAFQLTIANYNSPEQIILAGDGDEVIRFYDYLKANQYQAKILPVSHGFHSKLVADAGKRFYEKIKDLSFYKPKVSIMSCEKVDFYNEIGDMPNQLQEQITGPVRFSDSIVKLYEAGVRVFIESGPSDVLSKLVKNILSEKEVQVIHVNHKNKSGVDGFHRSLGELFAIGFDVTPVLSNEALGIPYEDKVAESRKPVFFNKKESIVYSGVSVGLPGTFKKAFSDDNFEYLMEGRNFIEMLTEDEAQSIMDLNVTRLIKTEKESIFRKISSINEVIHFAGKFGKIDMIEDYSIDEKILDQMTQVVCAGVAAGYEALKDAGIPLVQEYVTTSAGRKLPGRMVLPEEMQEDTGIIFVSGLYPVESVIQQVAQYTASKFGAGTRKDLIEFFENAISKVSDLESKKILSDWFTLHYSKLSNHMEESQLYEFNHNFLAMLTSQANNRLAQFIKATGPNLFLSATCSSTASAITVAEDLIRAGHARRMIVIGAEITSGKTMLPWFGAAFSSIGALNESKNLFEAAVPFDNRRSGMIMSSGAVGLIIEKEEDVKSRGMSGICRIMGTHLFNAGGHQSRIDTEKHTRELEKFIGKMEVEYQLDRKDMASKMVYCSHETYSHRQNGCAKMEKHILEQTFGEDFRKIKVINTKGMTGHTLGASIEEAVSAKVLQYQRIPPIVNYKEPDKELEGLNLSKGGAYTFEFVLRTVAALGGHGNYQLLQKLACGDNRILNPDVYKQWVDNISSHSGVVSLQGRLLVVMDQNQNNHGEFQKERKLEQQENNITEKVTVSKEIPLEDDFQEQIRDEVLEIYAQITRYPEDMLSLSMEAEADLGIDTVKQATIFSLLAERFRIELPEGEALSDYPTIGDMVKLVLKYVTVTEVEEKMESLSNSQVDQGDAQEKVLLLISEITKYPVEMLEGDMELEADLGIDTIKQATIISELGQRFQLDHKEPLNLSQLKTIQSLVDVVSSYMGEKEETVEKEVNVYEKESEQPKEIVPLCIQYPQIIERKLEHKEMDLSNLNMMILGDNKGSVKEALFHFKGVAKSVSAVIFEDIEEMKIQQNLDLVEEEMKRVDLILDYSHIGKNLAIGQLNQEEEKVELALNSVVRFLFYKRLVQVRPEPKIKIICAVEMDGSFGYESGTGVFLDPYYGGLCGFYKGLRKELDQSCIKIVDLGALEGLLAIEKECKEDLLSYKDCLLTGTFPDYEVGYWNQKRVTLHVENVDRSDMHPVESLQGNHFLVTGGGNGITAEMVLGIAKKMDAKFTVIGRTKLPDDIGELVRLDLDTLEQKKLALYHKYQGEGKKVSPIEIEKAFDKMRKAIDVYRLIQKVKELGSEITYYSCDVTDYTALEEVVTKAQETYGSVQVVIHGAGVEKSRLLSEKSRAEFEEIFMVKALGLCNLYRLLEKESIKAIIGLSSISARFGNEAQLDYCAGNQFISSFMFAIPLQHPQIRGVSLAWSGWGDQGMAARNEFVVKNAEKMGLHLIESDRGTEEFLKILQSSFPYGEIVISKGLSHFTGEKKWSSMKDPTPFLDWVTKHGGEIKKVHKVLSVKTDPLINNHRLGTTPLMPAVGFMEMAAQAYSEIYSKKEQYTFLKVRLDNPLKLYNEKPQEVYMNIQRDSGVLTIETYHNFRTKIGETKQISLNTMKIFGGVNGYEGLESLREINTVHMKTGFLAQSLDAIAEKNSNTIRLGTLFMDQKGREVNGFAYNEKEIVLTVSLSQEQITNKLYHLDQLHINPAFADTLMQVCGIHSSIESDGVYLPWEIGEFGVVKVPRQVGMFRAYGRLKGESTIEKSYDVLLCSDQGEVYYYARDVIVKRISA